MALKEKTEGDIVILYPRGFLMGGAETDELHKRVQELEAAGNQKLVINLADTSMMNSTAIGVFITAHKHYSQRGAKLKLCNVDAKINNVFVITRLSLVFDVYESEAAAIASFAL
ncbi:MAG: STAS domain-containing protein [Candidatus Eisenbacteria bacterium]|nr:STAS domain-containing protein [Candidatus Eisenbacteria bacterium]